LTDIHKTIVVTGVGVVSPYGIGLDCLQAGMLSGKCCLEPTKICIPASKERLPRSRNRCFMGKILAPNTRATDQLAVVAAQDCNGKFRWRQIYLP